MNQGPRPKSRVSAGILMYRHHQGDLEVLLVHPGGPFFKNKDEGAWSIPKGEVDPGEDLLVCAIREFQEELGVAASGPFTALTPVKQKGGKVVHAWATPGDIAPTPASSNTFSMEWPPRSGKITKFPEVDQAAFFSVALARTKINVAQAALITELQALLSSQD
jgi:predicted NUDIX family NTP pyrophosphohydrolase